MILNKKLLINIEIAKTLSINSLKVKYRRNFLGILWSLLNPLLSITLVSLVFSLVMGLKYTDFILIFFPAFLAWNLFASILTGAMGSLLLNEGLIKKTPIELFVFPLATLMTSSIEFMISFVVLLLISFFIGLTFTVNLLLLPLAFLLLAMFSIGIGLILSIICTKWRDLIHIIGILLQLLFYISPVLYPKDFVLGKNIFVDYLFAINPMVYYIDLFRSPIAHASMVSLHTLLMATVFAFISFILGLIVFSKSKTNLAVRM